MSVTSIDRLTTSRRNLRELNLPQTIEFPLAAVLGSLDQRRQVIAEFNRRTAERDKVVQEKILAWLQITSDT